MAPKTKRKVLVVGGQFTGGFTARELKKQFNVTVVDAKEYFEYTPGILRAFVKPAHFDALSFTLQPVLERKMGVKFIWGEVVSLTINEPSVGEDGKTRGGGEALIKPMFAPDGEASALTPQQRLDNAKAEDERINGQFQAWLDLITDEKKAGFKKELEAKWAEAREQNVYSATWRGVLEGFTKKAPELNWKACLTERVSKWVAAQDQEKRDKWAKIENAFFENLDEVEAWYAFLPDHEHLPSLVETVRNQFEHWIAKARFDPKVAEQMKAEWARIRHEGCSKEDAEAGKDNGNWKKWIGDFAETIKAYNANRDLPQWPGLPQAAENLLLEYRNRAAAMKTDCIKWDFCVICSGCNFGPFNKWGESLWFPTIHTLAREQTLTNYAHIDERFIEGRRRHILEVYDSLCDLPKGTKMLVVGAGFIGVEWVTELQYFFPDLKLTICDFAPRCLGPLPEAGAEYCTEYMESVGIKQFYGNSAWNNAGYPTASPSSPTEDWSLLELDRSDFYEKGASTPKTSTLWVCIGVKPCNHYLPEAVLSRDGPMQTVGWIHMNQYLQASRRPQQGFGLKEILQPYKNGDVFAVGDCNYGCINGTTERGPPQWLLPPIPKISYPGEEQAMHACVNLKIQDAIQNGSQGWCGCFCQPKNMKATWWPWGAGMFATSLGPHDACFILAANENRGSGFMVNWWYPAALQKEIIETTKVDEMKDNCIGILIWHFVHHTPVNCWGRGPCVPCQCCPAC